MLSIILLFLNVILVSLTGLIIYGSMKKYTTKIIIAYESFFIVWSIWKYMNSVIFRDFDAKATYIITLVVSLFI